MSYQPNCRIAPGKMSQIVTAHHNASPVFMCLSQDVIEQRKRANLSSSSFGPGIGFQMVACRMIRVIHKSYVKLDFNELDNDSMPHR
jgi:hypothetical protein